MTVKKFNNGLTYVGGDPENADKYNLSLIKYAGIDTNA